MVPVPIVVGVTGHCDIDPTALPAVRAAVVDSLKHLHTLFPGALHVMTALAEGADQLVAQIADQLCIPIIAVLPMPAATYRTKIDPAAQDQFDAFWNKAALKIELPPMPNCDDPQAPDYDNKHYEQLGAFIARRAHVVLALWEGPERAQATRAEIKPGGTADVLRMRFDVQRVLPIHRTSMLFTGSGSHLDAPHAEPVLQIVTPRRHQGGPPPSFAGWTPPAGALFLLHSWAGFNRDPMPTASRFIPTLSKEAARAFHQIQTLNKKIASLPRKDPQTFIQQLGYLNTTGVSDIAPGAPLDRLKRLQAGVDTASARYQRRLLGHFVGRPIWDIPRPALRSWMGTGPKAWPGVLFLFTLGVPVAAFMFEAYSKLDWGLLPLATYLVIFGFALLMRTIIHRGTWQDHFQDYRALAEALRVQLYWAIAGLPLAASDNYLRKQAGELGWIQFALRGPALWGTALALSHPAPNRPAVTRGWIEDQAKYFIGADRRSGKALQNEKAQRRNKWVANFLFVLGLGVALAILIADLNHEHHFNPGTCIQGLLEAIHHIHRELDVTTVVLLAAAAALAVSTNLRAYEAHAHNYKQMGTIFDRANTVASGISREGDPCYDRSCEATFQDLVRELGREALSENAEWLMDHRDRAVEPGP